MVSLFLAAYVKGHFLSLNHFYKGQLLQKDFAGSFTSPIQSIPENVKKNFF